MYDRGAGCAAQAGVAQEVRVENEVGARQAQDFDGELNPPPPQLVNNFAGYDRRPCVAEVFEPRQVR